MRILFRCGHRADINPDKVTSPVCGECGDRVVARVLDAPTPSFRGHCSGPYAQRTALPAIAVNLVEPDAAALPLKAH